MVDEKNIMKITLLCVSPSGVIMIVQRVLEPI